MSVYVKQNSVANKFDTDNSWTILSPIEQSIKAKIEAVGTPLKEWDIKINRGILTGCNEAFIITREKREEILSNCKTDQERDATAELIRPILRGRDIKRYGYEWANLYIIALFPSREYDIEDYPSIRDYLLSAEWSNAIPNGSGLQKLEQTGQKHIINGVAFTSRKKTGNKWFETQDQIGYWDDFSKQKIVWAELARTGNAFTIDDSNAIVLNSAYVLVCNSFYDNKYCNMVAFLNSPCALFYLDKLTSKFDETGWRWLKQFIELIPVPQNLSTSAKIVILVKDIEHSKKKKTDSHPLEAQINNILYEELKFSTDEITYLERHYSAILN